MAGKISEYWDAFRFFPNMDTVTRPPPINHIIREVYPLRPIKFTDATG